jgi:hypothetical protein
MALRLDTTTLGTIALLKDLLLFNRSIVLSVINYKSSSRIISKDELKRAIEKVLYYNNVTFQSEE